MNKTVKRAIFTSLNSKFAARNIKDRLARFFFSRRTFGADLNGKTMTVKQFPPGFTHR